MTDSDTLQSTKYFNQNITNQASKSNLTTQMKSKGWRLWFLGTRLQTSKFCKIRNKLPSENGIGRNVPTQGATPSSAWNAFTVFPAKAGHSGSSETSTGAGWAGPVTQHSEPSIWRHHIVKIGQWWLRTANLCESCLFDRSLCIQMCVPR